jgi:hypothetical protein
MLCLILCKTYYYILYFCVLYVCCSCYVVFVVFACVAVDCLDVTPFWFGCIAVLSMCGDYECSVYLSLLSRWGEDCVVLSGMWFV